MTESTATDRSYFWASVQQELDTLPLAFERTKQAPLLKGIDCFTISFQSLGNETIYGHLLLPEQAADCPIVIDFLGYMNHVQEPFQFAHWLLIGCGCLVIDNRGQGGRTQDQVPYETTQHEAPFGRGILKKEDFYMKRLVADTRSPSTDTGNRSAAHYFKRRLTRRRHRLIGQRINERPDFCDVCRCAKPLQSCPSDRTKNRKLPGDSRVYRTISRNAGNDLSSHELF